MLSIAQISNSSESTATIPSILSQSILLVANQEVEAGLIKKHGLQKSGF